MMCAPYAEFVAIAVGQGDAFFLRSGRHRILVDGGRGLGVLPRLFPSVTRQTGVDVLICTHSDRDHAEGVLGFLRAGITAGELWLPQSWLGRLQDLLVKFPAFVEELEQDVADLSPPYPPGLGALGDLLGEEGPARKPSERGGDPVERETGALDERGFPHWLTDALCAERDLSAPGGPQRNIHGAQARLLREGLSAAGIIRSIVCEAYRRRLKIRWFEYRRGQVPSQQHLDPRPVNCVEVAISPPRVGALQYLALTRSNRESLVFQAEGDSCCPPVLFTADSPLSFGGSIHWVNGMISTAPHHGSEANAYAYRRFLREAQRCNITWVRSDGWFKRRPGPSYRAMGRLRACTRCWGPPQAVQHVRLVPQRGRWRLAQSRPCVC